MEEHRVPPRPKRIKATKSEDYDSSEDDGFDLHDLIAKHAYEQAIDAGSSPAEARVLQYLARSMEWRDNARQELMARQVRRAQTLIAEKLGMHRMTVHSAIRRLQKLGLIIDLDHNLRNVPHRYELTLDWSFSTALMAILGYQGQTGLLHPPVPAPPLVTSRRKAGHGARNGAPGNCNICKEWVPEGGGLIVKFQSQHRLFCATHGQYGRAAAAAGWPEDQPWPQEKWLLDSLMRGWKLGIKGVKLPG